MKKPTLTVIDQLKPDRLAPPASLGEAGRKLWESVHADFVVTDAAGLETVLRICEAVDKMSPPITKRSSATASTIKTKAGGP